MSAKMERCEVCGGFYDKSKNSQCPYCSGQQNAADKTMTLNTGMTQPTADADRAYSFDDGRTQTISRLQTGVDPVVGWLICVSGNEMGRDYKVHADNNYIGRSERMDICIRGDETISRENHATITYDNRDRVFYFTPGEGRSIVRLNGKALLMTSEIKAYDKVELGTTELVFIPLCGGTFDWSDFQKEEEEEAEK